MIDGRSIFDQHVKTDIRIYEKIRKVTTGQRDTYTTGYLFWLSLLKKKCKLIAIDLSKQQAFHADL